MSIRLRLLLAIFCATAFLLGASEGLAIAAPISPFPAQTSSMQEDVLVNTASGAVQGVMEGDVVAFRGIPYATPPLGELRWRAPQPVTPWTDVLQADALAHDCMQVRESDAEHATTSEDCLYLNAWKPAGISPDAALPVMVWIHGGGFVQGGSWDPFLDGGSFARNGVVVVSINYRLGRLGFFAHPALLAAGEGPVGNFGYMDQIAALRWVQENIAAFGGDPTLVTIIGESAGGASVLAHLLSSESEGLFHQVAVMSGGGRTGLVLRPMTDVAEKTPSAEQTDADFALSLGIEGDGPETLAELRSLPAKDLVGNLDLEQVFKGGLRCVVEDVLALPTATACVPVFDGTQMIDGTIVTGHPGDLFARGEFPSMPMLIGTTAADVPGYFPPSVRNPWPYFGEYAERARAHYGLSPAVSAALAAADHPELVDILPLLAMGADITMHEPARFAASQMTAQGSPAWLYRFTYVAESERPSLFGQVHAGEVPYLFETLDAGVSDAVTENDRAMAHAFHTYIANFVKTGDPNGVDLPLWPAFDPAQYDLMDFTFDDGPVFGPDPRAEGIELIERAVDTQAGGESYSDPFAYCAATGTIGAPDGRFTGGDAPQAIAEALRAPLGTPADTPVALIQRTMVWRCMDGQVYACVGGANLPCEERADLSTEPTEAVQQYCVENPDSDFIPIAVTGRATIYAWSCVDGKPETGDAHMTPDAQGFFSEIWYRVEQPGDAAASAVISVGAEDNGATIYLTHAQTLEVSLPGNPSTGYTWSVAPESTAPVALAGEPEFKPKRNIPGVGGAMLLRFDPTGAGSGELVLHYARPWETDVESADTFKMTVVVALTPDDNGSSVKIGSGELLAVELPGNPATGYSWQVVDNDESVVVQLGEPAKAPASDAPGAGGTQLFTFQGVAPGEVTLHMKYARPWETEIELLDAFTLNVTVE